MSSPANPSTPNTPPPADAVVERCAGAGATHWTREGITFLSLVGVLDRRMEVCLGAVIHSARSARLPLVVDLSAVTRVSVDILALLLEAHADPGLTFVPPLPPSFLTLMAMTGTSAVFALMPEGSPDHLTACEHEVQ